MHLIAFSIPVFLAAILLEVLLARFLGRRVYRFTDAMVDLSCGIGSEMIGIFTGVVFYAGFGWAYAHRFVEWGDSPWVWVLAIVGVDFAYYWWHRHSHESNLLWGVHVVHHQSEDYNLAVALRQAWFTSLVTLPYYLPLAFLGVPPLVYAVANGLNLLYQFWIHTELIRKLGPLEWVFNTPSHHRVHHAVNEHYLDKNYAGILIIWDRIFGTFEPEVEPPTYGLVEAFASYDPIWANFHRYFEVAAMAARARLPLDKVRAWFFGPAWVPAGQTLKGPARLDRAKYDPLPSADGVMYVLAQAVILLPATMGMLLFAGQLPWWAVTVGAGLVITGTWLWGMIFERRAWVVPVEMGRVVASGAFVLWLGHHFQLAPPWTLLFAVAATVPYLLFLRRRGFAIVGG